MGKINGTWHSISMVVIIIFILAASGVINMTSSQYEAAESSLPSTVTVYDRSISLFSGENNFENALGYAYEDSTGTFNSMWCSQRFRISGNSKLVLRQISDHIYIYFLDPFGYFPDKCSIYNGITTASTKEELEAAFGTDCLKTDDYFAEVFIDGKEADYSKKQDYPEDFYVYYFSFEDWFEYMKKRYPNADTITVLICSYHDDSPNDIEFFIYPEITY